MIQPPPQRTQPAPYILPAPPYRVRWKRICAAILALILTAILIWISAYLTMGWLLEIMFGELSSAIQTESPSRTIFQSEHERLAVSAMALLALVGIVKLITRNRGT